MRKHLLKKSIIALTTSVAFVSMPFAAQVVKIPALDYVPADTAFFSGSLESFPIKTYMDLNSELFEVGEPEELYKMFEDDDKSSKKFFGAIVKDYYKSLTDSSSLLEKYGIGDETRMMIYGVGFLPVIKYEAENPDAIFTVFDAAAAEADVKSEEREIDGVKYKAYQPNNEDDKSAELIVAVVNGWVTITVAKPEIQNSHLKVALGIEKPAKSLGNTDILQDITDKYDFDGTQLAFIDHRVIVEKITSKDPLEFTSAEDWADMKDIQTPECRAEFAQIAKSWPRTVMGTDGFTITDNSYNANSRMIVESTNEATNTALMALRGFIPEHISIDAGQVYSMGLGVNMNQMTGTLTQLWSTVMQTNYKCEPLIEMQSNIGDANPAALGMFAGMAQGVMGLSVTLFDADVEMKDGKPNFKKLDGLISLASENPAAQLTTASMMMPPLRSVKLPGDGTPIVLNEIIPSVNMIGGETLTAAVGKHLNVYQGTQAAEMSASMKDVEIDANGFFDFYMHYGEFFTILTEIMKDQPDVPAEQMKQFLALSKSDMKVGFGIDFTKHGIEMSADISKSE